MLPQDFEKASWVFWDFDGVIKETVNLKGQAFVDLFMPGPRTLALRIQKHHRASGGISRFEKIPLYASWAGIRLSPWKIKTLCRQFSARIFHGVLHAPWVRGAETVLRTNPFGQKFALITATPTREMKALLRRLRIHKSFDQVIGAPTPKDQAIRFLLRKWHIPRKRCLMVGDSLEDFLAARSSGVRFLQRVAPGSKPFLQKRDTITDFQFLLPDSKR